MPVRRFVAPGPSVAHRDRGTTGEPAMDVGHERGALLVAGRDVADRLVARQRVEDVHRLLAGDARRRSRSPRPRGSRRGGRRRAGSRGRGSWRVSVGRIDSRRSTRALRSRRSEDRVRPSLHPAPTHRPDRRRGEARAGRGRHGDPRAGDAPPADRGRPADRTRPAIACCSRGRRRAGHRRRPARRSRCTTATATRTPTWARIASISCPARPGSRRSTIGQARSGSRTRPTSSSTSALADGLQHIAYLATAFSTNDDIEAQVSDAWRLYMVLTNSKKPVVSGAFTEHGVPRMVEMMQLFRADRADLIARPMSIFTITATGNFRYSRGLLPEPHRLRRGGRPGRDRAGDADGPDRAGHDGRRDGLPHGRRPGRHHDGPGHPAGRAGAVRRGAGDLPHEGRVVADVGDRGAPARRRLRRGREVARAAVPVVHGPVRRADPRRAGRRGDVRLAR